MRRPQIKGIHKPMRLTPTLISVGGRQPGIGAELDDEDGTLWRLLGLMDGTRTRGEIVTTLVAESPGMTAEEAAEALQGIIDAGFVEDAAAAPPPSLSPAELERYDRAFNYFAWIDLTPRTSRYDLQARLKSSTAVILGLGGTGSAVASSLVAAGIGALHCVDYDRIEPGNLTRQLLYTEDDIGAGKVTVAVDRLRRMNSYARITGEETRVESVEGMAELMEGRDLFVLCADQPLEAIRDWANRAALRTATPWMIAQYAGPMAVIGLFVPGQTGCYACLLGVNDWLRDKYGEKPEELFPFTGHSVIAPAANLTGHIAALDAVYHLAGLPTSTLGKMYHLSLTDLSLHYVVTPRANQKCGTCGWIGAAP